MKLFVLCEDQSLVGQWVRTRVPFRVEWDAPYGAKRMRCKKGERLKPFNYGPDLAWVCSINFDRGRPDLDVPALYTATVYFPSGGLQGHGCIGQQSAESVDALFNQK